MADTPKGTSTQTSTRGDASGGFTDDEKAAMRERSRELKAARKKGGKADGEADLWAKVAEMPEADRRMAERIHAIVKEHAPMLEPKTWYGMPAYARDGKVVCFFQAAAKFNARYATFGFNDSATLDDGSMWATAFALARLTKADEQRLAELIKRAVG